MPHLKDTRPGVSVGYFEQINDSMKAQAIEENRLHLKNYIDDLINAKISEIEENLEKIAERQIVKIIGGGGVVGRIKGEAK